MAGKGHGSALEGFVHIGLAMSEAEEPEAAFDGANAAFEQAATEMGPARGILALDVVAVVEDRAFGSAGLQHGGVEDETGTLGAKRDAVLIRQGAETGHELLT